VLPKKANFQKIKKEGSWKLKSDNKTKISMEGLKESVKT
jgi:hypothetical protein